MSACVDDEYQLPSFEIFQPTVTRPQQEGWNFATMIRFNHVLDKGEQMIVDLESWEAGYDDGLLGRPSQCTQGLDPFSYSSGYCQAHSCRACAHEDPRYTRSLTQRGRGSSRLIII
jgi:hypothetical protein